MQMQLRNVDIHPRLKGYVEKIWIFESSGKVPVDDMKLIAPNGLIKLVIPYRNSLSGSMQAWQHTSREHEITLIGICDLPSIVEAEFDKPSGTIGVEFNPSGAYRFFSLRQSDIRNTIHPLSDVLGKIASDMEERIAEVADVSAKVRLLQAFLLRLFEQGEEDMIYEFCAAKIRESRGGISVKELEKLSGYSARWLNMKFDHKLGISPKNLCALTRFQYYYQALARTASFDSIHPDFRTLYYDQAHFIREFKRFTGLAPTRFVSSVNDFGKIFYKN